MPDQSLGSVFLSGMFIIVGLLALAWALYRDEVRSWWDEVTKDPR